MQNAEVTATTESLTLRERVGKMLVALADVYTIPAVAYALVRFISGYALWPAALISNLLPWMAIPGLLLTAVHSVRRRWVRAALNVPIAVMFVILYGGLFVPKASPPPCTPPCKTIYVLHLNLASGMPQAEKL